MAEALFLGLDVGTSGVKAMLVVAIGEVVRAATTPLQLSTPHPGWAEQDPEAMVAGDASRRFARSRCEGPGARVASSASPGRCTRRCSSTRAASVIRPALLWCDGRTTAECREITTRVGGEARLRDLASNPALEGFTLPKVLWLRNHEPEAFARLSPRCCSPRITFATG